MGKEKNNCLVCKRVVGLADQKYSSSSKGSKAFDSSIISRHISVIFILRNIFEVPADQLAKELERNPDIDKWFSVCKRCSKLVWKCREIFNELVEITKRFKACRLEVIEIVKEKGDDSENDAGEYSLGPSDGYDRDYNFVESIQKFVVNNNYRNLIDPECKNTDLLLAAKKNKVSQEKMVADSDLTTWEEETVVKMEVDEDKLQDHTYQPSSEEEWQPDDDNRVSDEESINADNDNDSDNDSASAEDDDEFANRRTVKTNIKACKKTQFKYQKSASIVRCPYCNSHRFSITHKKQQISKMCTHLKKCSAANNGKNIKTKNVVEELKCDICSSYSCSVNDIYEFVYHMLCCAYHKKISDPLESLLPPLKQRIFWCNICQDRKLKNFIPFFEMENFLTHYAYHKRFIYECTECGELLPNIDRSHNHWRTKHTHLMNSVVVDMSTCQRKLDSPPVPDVPWWCFQCGDMFNDEAMRDEHCINFHSSSSTKREPQEDKQKCQFCEKEYQCPDELRLHQGTVHTGEVPNKKAFTCEQCKDSFSTEIGLQQHRRRIHKLDRFECHVCKRSFLKRDILKRHMKIHENTENDDEDGGGSIKMSLKCRHCDKTYLTEKNLETHIAIAHDKTLAHSCHVCGKNFTIKSSLTSHLANIHEIGTVRRYYCTVEGCGRFFRKRFDLQEHVTEIHEKTTVYPCSFCGKKFYNAQRLKIHETRVHENTKDPSKKLQCDQCPFLTSYPYNLKMHKIKLHKSDGAIGATSSKREYHNCDMCPQYFTELQELHTHKKESHYVFKEKTVLQTKKVEKPYERNVEECLPSPEATDHEPITSSTVNEAEIVVSSSSSQVRQPFQCTECGKVFKNTSGLKRHTRRHTRLNLGEESKSFVCEICGKAFAFMRDLTLHKRRTLRCKRLHMSVEEATVVCNICQNRYSCKISLAKHIRHSHQRAYKETCEHCGKGLEDKSKLTQHLATVHKIPEAVRRAQRYKCTEEGCDECFFLARDLRDHISKHKGEPGYKCKQCGMTFYRVRTLNMHVRCVHKGYKYVPKIKDNVDVPVVNNALDDGSNGDLKAASPTA